MTESDDSVEVLYLEDDPDLAELYRLKLQSDGYHVRTVPLDGVPPTTADSPTPELLFVDVGSQVRRGLDALAVWRAAWRFREIPAVILSTVNRRALEQRGIRLTGLDQILVAPAAEGVH